MSGKKTKFTFIGFAISDLSMDIILKKDKLPPYQTHKYTWNLVDLLSEFGEVFLISAMPVSDYPKFKRVCFGFKKYSFIKNKKKFTVNEIGFINYSVLKIITRFFSLLFVSLINFRKVIQGDFIIVYSVHYPFMLIGYLASKLTKKPLVGVWTDPPAVGRAEDDGIKARSRNIEASLCAWVMRKFDMVIVVSEKLALDFAPGTPYLVVEPMHLQEEYSLIGDKESRFSDQINIVYTGSLDERYGIRNLIDGFSLLVNDKVTLSIYGRGDLESFVEKSAKKFHNIKYYGYVSPSLIIGIQRAADFLINTRPSDSEFVKYSFPSKMVEYMASGTPVITTYLSGISSEYMRHVILLPSNSPKDICTILNHCCQMSPIERQSIGNKAKKFIAQRDMAFYKNKLRNFFGLVDG